MTEAVAAQALRAPAKPATKPERPYFSSGPCAKPPGWSADKLDTSALGRSHRGDASARRSSPKRSSAPTRCSSFPPTTGSGSSPHPTPARWRWRSGRCSAPRPVTMLAWESFGAGWVTDVAKQLKLDADIRTADYGEIADLVRDRSGERRRLHLERDDQRRSRARTPTGSPPTAPASRSATRPRRRSRRTSTGRRSMSAPSAGRRRSAAKRRTACSCSARARSSGSSASPRRGRCPRSSA